MLALLGAACHTPRKASKDWSFTNGIGLVMLKDGRACLSIHNPSLPPNTGVRIVTTSPPQAESDAHILKSDATCPNTNTGVNNYDVSAGAAGLAPSMPAIALVGFSGKFNRQGDLISADLDGDGQDEFFRSCTSTEGIHFTVWSGKPLDGKIRWHEYYYLGYDVSPNCEQKETEAPK